ncbi:MAG: hypothetical protein V7K27_06430 [Nostoc sp.]
MYTPTVAPEERGGVGDGVLGTFARGLMQANALTMQANALTMQPDALTM